MFNALLKTIIFFSAIHSVTLAASDKIIAISAGEMPYLTYYENDTLQGFQVDIVKSIFNEAKVEIEFRKYPFD
jgi:hypothetical protein